MPDAESHVKVVGSVKIAVGVSVVCAVRIVVEPHESP